VWHRVGQEPSGVQLGWAEIPAHLALKLSCSREYLSVPWAVQIYCMSVRTVHYSVIFCLSEYLDTRFLECYVRVPKDGGSIKDQNQWKPSCFFSCFSPTPPMADFFDTLFLALDGNFRLRERDRGERNVDLVSSADVHAEMANRFSAKFRAV
jgi:hypothetical protein